MKYPIPSSGLPNSQESGEEPTRRRVITLLAQQGLLTVPQLAQRLGLTVPAVRRHLDLLEQEGLVAGEQAAAAQRGRGRPARAYRLSAAGRAHLGSDYDHLATEALQFLAQAVGREGVRQFAHARAQGMQQRYAQALHQVGPQQRVQVLAQMLTADGYYAAGQPESATPDSPSVVCQHHCPVSGVAGDFPELCEEETAMFSRLLGMPVTRTATIAAGAPGCITHIDTSTTTAQETRS